ncbi:cupin domain-containing protein [Mesorhizobium sp. 1B3]|uniref:cupin domain-containing protein n=1 Tax=Mesorhizobium sp. 1B3 TaxID=3243599 RepID=UPI003D97D59C
MHHMRRLVTAIAADGVSRVSSVGPVTARRETGGGGLIEEVWHTRSLDRQAFEPDQSQLRFPDFSPGAGGSSCRVVHIPPDAQRWADAAAAGEMAQAIGADRPARWLKRHPGMHVTQTLDYALLLRGRLTMVMEDGEIELEPGDVVVQQAAVHAWKNTGHETAVLFVVMLGLQEQAVELQEESRNG